MENVGRQARAAAHALANLPGSARNHVLEALATHLKLNRVDIVKANEADKTAARAAKLDSALQSRLDVAGKFNTLLEGIEALIAAEDPCDKVLLARELAPGLNMYRRTCPIGVLCIIFESRPEAAVQIASLAIKSGNAVILKGGKEAAQSNAALVAAMRAALIACDVDPNAIQLVSTKDDVAELLKMDRFIDLVIPRGSNAMVKSIMESTRIPVMGHADGVCYVYVDKAADLDTAVKVVVDSKTQYPAACNTAETLLVHRDAADTLLLAIGSALVAKGVSLVADAEAMARLPRERTRAAAPGFEFDKEYLALEMSVKVVGSLDEAVEFINAHGSHHTDVIVTTDDQAAAEFMRRVDSAGVYHNASSRFADGFRYGFGAEVGVSTSRLHARGPVGVEGLMTYKYFVHGNGHVVEDFAKNGAKFTHKDVAVDGTGGAKRAKTA